MKILKRVAMFSLLLPTILFADNVAVGSRPMSEEAAEQVEKERGKKESAEEEEQETASYVFDRYPPVYYSSSHHRLTSVTILDNNECTIELEDGSVWKISSYDESKARHWKLDDPLTITQNNRWFTKYDYRIINKANGTSLEANLFLGPALLGEYSRFIIGIDHIQREILLSDNSHWEISCLDSSIFKDWAIDDYLIIGTNSNTSIWDSSSDAILINVNMNNCARAKQF